MKEIKNVFGFCSKWERKLFEKIPPEIYIRPKNVIFYDGAEMISRYFISIRQQTNEYIEASD